MNHEMQLIGLIMKYPEMLDYCGLIKNFEKPFSTKNLNSVFQDCLEIYGETGKVDRRELLIRGQEKNVDRNIYLELMKNAGFKENLQEYVKLTYGSFVKRRLSGLGQLTVNCYQDDLGDHERYLSAVRNELEYIESNSAVLTGVTLPDAVKAVTERAIRISENDQTVYHRTGILALDRIINGFTPKTMSVIGARPSIGKSALGLTIMSNMTSYGLSCGFISVEMSEDECVERLMQVRTGVSIEDFKTDMPAPKFRRFQEEGAKIAKSDKIQIVRTTDRKISNIRALARQMKNRDPNLKVLFIDYLQKLQGDGKHENKRNEVGSVSGILTDMATDLGIHICCLAQINRAGDEVPKVSHLKESGDIEQDAHYIILIHRDLGQQFEGEYKTEAKLIVGKNRGGRTGVAQTMFNCKTTRFYDEVTGEYDG
jgi:replicative DNA helicase